MFISVAIKLTPEVEEALKVLMADAAPGQTDLLREMLNLRQLANGPSIPEIARTVDLAAQTVRRLDKQARPETALESYKSAFISYGGPDEVFARRLYESLVSSGVHTYYFPESSVPGRQLHRTMNDAVYEYDVVILVCSKSAVTRPGWLNELEQTLVREAREGGAQLLIPVLLDDYVLSDWAPARKDLARQVQSRVAADFRSAVNEEIYQKQFARLLHALER